MKKFLKILGWSLAAIVGLAVVAYSLAWWVSSSRYDRQWVAHDESFQVPFPLDDAEILALKVEWIAAGSPPENPLAGVDLQAAALDRAIARGQRMVKNRLGCAACHRPDFGGGALIDDPIVGRWIAPNITTGKGSVALDYTAADWDRAVRHGLRRGGRTSTMPSIEFVNLSDRELSDIVAYIRSKPPVDKDPGKVELGPLLKVMVALDKVHLLAFHVDHMAPHPALPPEAAPTVEFGAHLVQACRGCHAENLAGGKIPGDPGMPIVANLTPHETGLKRWNEGDFLRAIREGKRPNGSAISGYMPWKAYAAMSDTELKAIWAYLQTVPAVEKGKR